MCVLLLSWQGNYKHGNSKGSNWPPFEFYTPQKPPVVPYNGLFVDHMESIWSMHKTK
jgi:hypothetical protein